MNYTMARIIKRKLERFPLDDCHPIHARMLDLGDPLPPRRGNRVVAVSGVRRCGKSYRLFQEMQRLISEGVPRYRICYFDFEDDRLGSVTPALGTEVLETFFDLYPVARREGAFLFLDGIHAMEGWRSWVRHIADELRATVYVAGSASRVSAIGWPGDGGGDVCERHLYPYSFAEYLRARTDHDVSGGFTRVRSSRRHAVRLGALTRYLTNGGFPGTVGLADESRVRLLQECTSRIVHEDVIVAGNFSNPQVAIRFAHRALSTNSQALSFRRSVGNFLKAGVRVEKDYLRELLDSILGADLMFRIPCFDLAEGEAPCDQCKLYAIDPGLARACARVHGNAISFLLENAVYLELRRRTSDRGIALRCIRNRANNHEVDFVTGDPLSDGPSRLYQVAWSIDNRYVRRREVRSILETFDEIAQLGRDRTAMPEATILIGDCTEESLARDRHYLAGFGELASRINLVPAPDWLLNVPAE